MNNKERNYPNVESSEHKGFALRWMQEKHYFCRKQHGGEIHSLTELHQGNMPKVGRETRRVQTGTQTFLFLLKPNKTKQN